MLYVSIRNARYKAMENFFSIYFVLCCRKATLVEELRKRCMLILEVKKFRTSLPRICHFGMQIILNQHFATFFISQHS